MAQENQSAYRSNDELLTNLREAADLWLQLLALSLSRESFHAEASDVQHNVAAIQRQSTASTRTQLLNLYAQLQDRLNTRCKASVEQGIFYPWIHITRVLLLNPGEQSILLLALLPWLDKTYQKLFNQFTDQALPDGTVSVAMEECMVKAMPEIFAFPCLSEPANACFFWQLLQPQEGFRDRYTLDPAIAGYLMGKSVPTMFYRDELSLLTGDIKPDQLLPDELTQIQRFFNLAAEQTDNSRGYLLHLRGQDQKLLREICAGGFGQLSLRCYELDGLQVQQAYLKTGKDLAEWRKPILRLCRNALLSNAVLVLNQSQWNFGEENIPDLQSELLNVLLSYQGHLAVVNAPDRQVECVSLEFDKHPLVYCQVAVSLPDIRLRETLWQQALREQGVALEQEAVTQLAARFPLSHRQIQMALKHALIQAELQAESLTLSLLLSCCRDQSHRVSLPMATEIQSPYRKEDIVLPPATWQNLDEILRFAQQRHRVMDTWGFERRHPNSKNMSVLFHGPSGTGKTMAASIIANELNLALYKINLAQVVNKYVGETEKQLARLFDRAEAMNIVLFFDEADSLFGSRTESKDAHDRYANLQTGYLLQRIETYPGIVVLSTNLLNNIDKAFIRRFKFIVEYPFPSSGERYRLWQKAFPDKVPLAGEIDYELLSEQAPLSGGSINNVALSAAMLAAEENSTVGWAHILRGVEQEFAKFGKVFEPGDFVWPDEG